MLVGGFAVIAYGASRLQDIDLLVDDAPGNVALVKRGLGVLADNAAADVQDDDIGRSSRCGSPRRWSSI